MTLPSWGVVPPVIKNLPAWHGDEISAVHGLGKKVEYTYLAATLFGDEPICELPLTGVSFNWKLNTPGTLSATLNVSTFGVQREYFRATDPCRTVLYVIREGVPVWGGIIWKRSFDSESRGLRIDAETWDSYLNRRMPFENIHVAYDNPKLPPPASGTYAQGIEQIQMFRELWNYMSLAESGNIGVTLGPGDSNVRKGYDIAGAEQQKTYASWILEKVVEKSNGFEWFSTVALASDGSKIERRIEFAAPKFGREWEDTGLVWEYPGNLLKYTWTSDGTKSATVMYVLGEGTPPNQARGYKKNQQAHDEGYPRIDLVEAKHKGVADSKILDSHAARYLYAYQPPFNEIDIEPHPTVPISLGQYFIGDRIRFVITDDLFAHADIQERDLIGRVLGIAVTIAEDGLEKVVPDVTLDSRYLEIIDEEDAGNEFVPDDWKGLTISPPNDFPQRPPEPPALPLKEGRRRLWTPESRGTYGLLNAQRFGESPWLESRP